MLVFYPDLFIDYEWTTLIDRVKSTAKNYVQTGEYKNHLMYTSGASEVANVPGGGWLSKQDISYDFFVMGGIEETDNLENKFKELFPTLTFTPATICYSSKSVPKHKDSIKNGQASLVYPLHDHPSVSKIYNNDDNAVLEYKFEQDRPVILNITKQHEVVNLGERVWFSIHFHESIEQVKTEFDTLGKIII
jgi:hypothetical protein